MKTGKPTWAGSEEEKVRKKKAERGCKKEEKGRIEELAVRRVYTLGIGLHFQPIGPMVFTQDPVENRTLPSVFRW